MLRRLAWVPWLLAVSGGCGSPSTPGHPIAPNRAARAKPGAAPGVPALRSTSIAKVPEGTFGPYLGQSRDGALVAWAAAEGEARGWYVATVDAAGTLKTAAKRIADAPPDVGLVVVRGSLDAAGFAIASTRRTALSEWIEVTLLGAGGELVAGPRPLAEVHGQTLWVEVVPMGARRLVLWAVPKADLAELYGVVVGPRGEPEGDPRPLVSAARAWQALPFGGGMALGSVGSDGQVRLLFTDDRGEAKNKPLVLNATSNAQLDFDLALVGDALVAAWSDTRDGESRVYRAVVGPDRAVRGAEGPLTPPLGEQALVRVVSQPGATRAWVVWESISERRAETRMFDLAGIDASGRLSPERARLEFESDEGAVPELAALKDGVAALTLASACRRGDTCEEADVMPTFVRFGPTLALQASEPLRLEALAGDGAELGWGLACRETRCFALAALGTAPAPVFLTALERRSDAWRPAGRLLGVEPPPRVRENRALARTDTLSDLALAKVGTGSLAAYLTDFDPATPWVKLKQAAPDGRFEPLRARLGLIGLRADGTPLAAEQPLSLRAHSLGGIALSPGAPGGDLLAAWTGVDFGQPQVFLTLVGPDGARRSQRMLTRKSGDASDVAATPVGKGWVVAWVDERDRDPELYVTRVDEKLSRIGSEHRLTNAPGPATQVTLESLGDTTVIAWADARDPAQPGEADIFLSRVTTRDATPLSGGERRVLATRGHSFAPVLGRLGQGLVLMWLERGTPEVPHSAGLLIQRLDASGLPQGEPERVELDQGEPTALALDCSATGCHLVVAARQGDVGLVLGGVRGPGSEPVRLKRLVSLGSKSAASVPLALVGEELVYADANDDGIWRVRRALLDWP
jgi:hypothetical protein